MARFRRGMRRAGARAVRERLKRGEHGPLALSVLIETLGVSRVAAAKSLDVSESQMSNYLRGYTPFPEKRRPALMCALIDAIAGMEVEISNREAVVQSVLDKPDEVWLARTKELRSSVELAKAVWEQEMGFSVNEPADVSYAAAHEAAKKELTKQGDK